MRNPDLGWIHTITQFFGAFRVAHLSNALAMDYGIPYHEPAMLALNPPSSIKAMTCLQTFIMMTHSDENEQRMVRASYFSYIIVDLPMIKSDV
jgi:hypothetical protein